MKIYHKNNFYDDKKYTSDIEEDIPFIIYPKTKSINIKNRLDRRYKEEKKIRDSMVDSKSTKDYIFLETKNKCLYNKEDLQEINKRLKKTSKVQQNPLEDEFRIIIDGLKIYFTFANAKVDDKTEEIYWTNFNITIEDDKNKDDLYTQYFWVDFELDKSVIECSKFVYDNHYLRARLETFFYYFINKKNLLKFLEDNHIIGEENGSE